MGFFQKIKRYAALASGNFEKIFKDKEIPPLPEAITKLLEKIRDPDVHMEDVANIISSDPGLSTQILKIVNSAMYGFPGQITSIKKAISLLGLKKIENVAISYGVMKAVKDPGKSGFDFNLFWSVSLYRAIVARELSKECRMGDPDEAFTGSLLQDIALPVLLKEWFDVYEKVYKKWVSGNMPLHRVEDQELSWNHAQAGAWLAKRWELPAILVCCIGLHIEPLERIRALELWNTSVVPVNLSAKLPVGDKSDELKEFVEAAKEVGISEAELLEVGSRSYQLLQDLAVSFGIRQLKVKSLEELLQAGSKS